MVCVVVWLGGRVVQCAAGDMEDSRQMRWVRAVRHRWDVTGVAVYARAGRSVAWQAIGLDWNIVWGDCGTVWYIISCSCSTMSKRNRGKCWYVVGVQVVGRRIYDSRQWDWLHLNVSLRALGFFGESSFNPAGTPPSLVEEAPRKAHCVHAGHPHACNGGSPGPFSFDEILLHVGLGRGEGGLPYHSTTRKTRIHQEAKGA